MLTAYLTRTRQLLQNPAASSQLYSDSDLTSYINTARGQLAGETECVRVYGTLALSPGAITYSFSRVSGLGTGVGNVLSVGSVSVGLASGARWITPRPFPWFQLYYLNDPLPQPGFPKEYSQFGPGTTSALYFT